MYSTSSWIEDDGLREVRVFVEVPSLCSLGWSGNTKCRHVHLGQRAMIEGARDSNSARIHCAKTCANMAAGIVGVC